MKIDHFGIVLRNLCIASGAAILLGTVCLNWVPNAESFGNTIGIIGMVGAIVTWPTRLIRGPIHQSRTYLDTWREDLPMEEWPPPPRPNNPWRGVRQDWMFDRGGGSYDRVFDAAVVNQAVQEKIRKSFSFSQKVSRKGSFFEAITMQMLGWVPRNQIGNYGYGNNPIWDPEQRRWFHRNNVPQKPGYSAPIQDTSTGDGSGA